MEAGIGDGERLEHESAPVDRAELLRSYLRDYDAPCPSCGYSLRDLMGDSCPECGEGIALRVELAQPKMRMWITGLIGLSLGLGFHGIVLVILLAIAFFEGAIDDLWPEAWPIGLGALVAGGGLAGWLAASGWIRRRPAGVRIGLSFLCWGSTAATVSLFLMVIT